MMKVQNNKSRHDGKSGDDYYLDELVRNNHVHANTRTALKVQCIMPSLEALL